jgi:hypothetical protein
VSGKRVQLDPGREARLKLAFYDAYDARDGDPGEYRRRLQYLIDLRARLRAEQLAELGYVPSTFAGCVAVLHVAARILDVIGGSDEWVP